MENMRVILASNHEMWWEGLSLLLAKEQEIQEVAMCYDAIETIKQANELKPDLILLDEEIAGGDCGKVAEQIYELNPEIKIIIIIKPYKNVNLASAFKARAKAYIDKDITYEELTNSVRQVANGGVVIISPVVAEQLLEHAASYERNRVNVRAEYDVGLSKREKEVLTLLVKRGTTNKEIAEVLCVTENTVKAHLSSILEKMKVRNRQQAAALAREKGLILV